MKPARKFFNEDLKPTDSEICTYKGRHYAKSDFNGVEIIYCKEDEYINATKMCQNVRNIYKINKRFDNYIRLKEWKEAVDVFNKLYGKEETTDDSNSVYCSSDVRSNKINPYYEICGVKNEIDKIKGVYVHRKLINFVAEWCSIEYSFRVSELMEQIDKKRHKENLSLREIIEKQNDGMKSIEGEIEIQPLDTDTYYLHMNQFKTTDKNPSFHYVYMNNAEVVWRNFIYYSSNGLTPNIEYLGKSKVKGNIDDITEIINKIIKKEFAPTISIEKSIKALDDKYNGSTSKMARYGVEFELYCAKKYNIPPFRFGNSESIGLTHKDVGCDLLDVENKIAAQCKRIGGNIYYNHVKSFINFVDFLKSSGEHWHFYLYCLNSSKIDDALEFILQDKQIEIIHEDFGIKPLEETLNTDDKKENKRFQRMIKMQNFKITEEELKRIIEGQSLLSVSSNSVSILIFKSSENIPKIELILFQSLKANIGVS